MLKSIVQSGFENPNIKKKKKINMKNTFSSQKKLSSIQKDYSEIQTAHLFISKVLKKK